MQASALALLATLFSEGSEYYRMSSLAHMGQTLPAFNLASGPGKPARGKPKVAVD